jgi:hypothetical protein
MKIIYDGVFGDAPMTNNDAKHEEALTLIEEAIVTHETHAGVERVMAEQELDEEYATVSGDIVDLLARPEQVATDDLAKLTTRIAAMARARPGWSGTLTGSARALVAEVYIHRVKEKVVELLRGDDAADNWVDALVTMHQQSGDIKSSITDAVGDDFATKLHVPYIIEAVEQQSPTLTGVEVSEFLKIFDAEVGRYGMPTPMSEEEAKAKVEELSVQAGAGAGGGGGEDGAKLYSRAATEERIAMHPVLVEKYTTTTNLKRTRKWTYVGPTAYGPAAKRTPQRGRTEYAVFSYSFSHDAGFKPSVATRFGKPNVIANRMKVGALEQSVGPVVAVDRSDTYTRRTRPASRVWRVEFADGSVKPYVYASDGTWRLVAESDILVQGVEVRAASRQSRHQPLMERRLMDGSGKLPDVLKTPRGRSSRAAKAQRKQRRQQQQRRR